MKAGGAGRAFILLLAACMSTSCGGGHHAPNILLISVDTLRPDHLGYGGAKNPTSPNLDRLSRQGVVFTRAYSQAGWTLPSMATILTGRYPKDHKAVDFQFGVDRDIPTLAALLRDHGYDTRAYVSHILLTEKCGINRGFEHFDASVLARGDPHKMSSSREITEIAEKDLAGAKQPFFAWIHYFDPHFAYLPHAEWSSFGDTDPGRYDQEIAYTDHYIGELLSFLAAKKMDGRTVVLFIADHGEEFGEHGGNYHETCYQEVLRVPLVIQGPGIAARTDSSMVEQTDVVPTLLALAGVPKPAECPGRDLLAAAGGGAAASAEHPIFVERDRPPGFRQRAVLFDGKKLIRIEPRDTTLIPEESRSEYTEVKNVAAGTYLFDLARDPDERTNLYRPDDPAAERMLAMLASYATGAVAPTASVTVDAEMREKLRSLGYIR